MDYHRFQVHHFKFIWQVIAFAFLFSFSINEMSSQEFYNNYDYERTVPHWQKEYRGKRHYPYVSEKNYQKYWDQGTFPTVQASINYHTRKHGYGRSQLEYTRDAVNFYERNQHLRYPTTLMDGSPGYRIRKGQQGGIWTEDGKILTYWD